MRLIANSINQVHLRDILPVISETVQVDLVQAAIAYGSSASNETQDLVCHYSGPDPKSCRRVMAELARHLGHWGLMLKCISPEVGLIHLR